MQAGAIGLSTGTFYPPAVKATTEEIIEVGRPLAARQALYVTHMRDESDRVMESLEETFRIGRALAIPVVVSHHKVQNTRTSARRRTLPFIRESDEAPVHRASTAIPTPRARP
jgi:N-acyl-D-amino-acid deacylase